MHICLLLAVALIAAPVIGAAQEGEPLLPLVSIGLVADAPVVDGVLDDVAWQGAGGFTGMVPIGKSVMAPDRTTVRMAYDAERLYIGIECVVQPGETPQGSATGHDEGRPWREDAVEVYLSPDPERPQDYYQVIGAAAGGIYDFHAGDPKWNGAWEYAAHVAEGAWTCELSIAFAELGVATPEAGMQWRANVCRDVVAGRSANESWAQMAASFKEWERLGRLLFVGDGPVVGVRDLGAPQFGRLAVDAVATNPGERRAVVKLSAWVVEPGTTITASGEEWAPMIRGKMVTAGEELTLEPGERREVRIAREFTDRALGLIVLSATGPDGGQLYAQQLPFELQTPLSVAVQPVPKDRRLIVSVISGLEGIDPQATTVAISAAPRRSETPCAELTASLADAESGVDLDYATWPVGEYVVTAAVADAAGEMQTASAPFEVVPTPDWVGNSLGRERVIVPPFEPITTSQTAFRVWGRRTEFADRFLPASMTSQDKELLAGPMRLVAMRDGERIPLTTSAPVTFSERSPDRVEFATAGSGAGIEARIDWWAEYDGFTWAEMAISAPERRTIDGLALEIPLRAEFARMIHADTNRRHAAINDFIGDEPFAWGFLPMIWTGDHDRGLCWFAESAEPFVPLDGERVVEVIPQGDTVLLRITMIGAPVEMTGRRRFGFGLLASPVRPLPEGWATMMIDRWPPRRSTVNWEAVGSKPDWGIIWNSDYGEHLTAPFWTPESVREVAALGREWGVGVMHYIAPGCHSMAYAEPQRYFEEWRIDPLDEFYIEQFDETYPRLCLNSSFADYLLAGIDYMVREFGIQGIYHDGGAPALCRSEVHGCGWRDENHRLRRIRPIRAYREYHKRLATMLWYEHGIEDFFIYDHTSDICWLPTLTFCNAHLDGEQYKGRRRARVPYSEILSRREIEPEYISTQWGVITVFLNICDREGEEGRACSATVLGYTLPYGIPFYPRYLYQEWLDGIEALYAQFDIDHATFHPYWRELAGFAAEADMERTPVSCFLHDDGRLLVVAGNITGEALSPTVRIDRDTLGLAADADVRQTISSDVTTSWEDGALTLQMPAHSFAMVWVE